MSSPPSKKIAGIAARRALSFSKDGSYGEPPGYDAALRAAKKKISSEMTKAKRKEARKEAIVNKEKELKKLADAADAAQDAACKDRAWRAFFLPNPMRKPRRDLYLG